MQDIESIINDTRKKMLEACQSKKHYASPGRLCVICDRKAVTSAYVESVIPEGYRKLTIDDFDGFVSQHDGKKIRVLSDIAVLNAKKHIIDFCWKGVEEGEPYDKFSWSQRSVIDARRSEGNNVIIYGNASQVKQGKLFKKPGGKTMIASIIMKEAISRKMYDGHLGDRFDWVDFGLLTKRLLAQAKGDKSHVDEIDDWEEADWLVVDGITFNDKTEGGRQFRASVLDQLFVERLEKRRPSILVFQDDIEKCEDVRAEFGTEISKIISGRKTLRISVNVTND